MKPCDLWILCLSASVFELKESVWYFSYFAIVIFVFSWPWGDTWQVLPQRRRQSPQPYQNSWGHAAPGWSLFILWLRSCLIWWWCLQHGTARPMWFQSTCCCTSSLPHRWRICLSASCWKLHYSGCSPAAAWSPPGPGPRGAPGSAAGCCVWPWWCGSSWTTAMIPWKNSIQNKFATRLQATAVKGCRPGCKHPVTRRGGEAAAPPAWRVTTSTAAASRRCRGSVEATATARVETAPWRLYRSGYWSCQVQWRMLPMFGFCCHRTPGSGHILLQAAGSGAGSGAGQRRRVAGTFLVGGRAAVFWNGCSMAQESILYRKDHCAILPRCCARHEWCCSIYSDRQLHFCRSFGHDFFRVAVSATFPGGNLEALECDLRVAEN